MKSTRTYEQFEYHTEDLECKYCEFYKGKRKAEKHGCWEDSCRFDDVKQEAEVNGRVKRRRDWNKK